MEVEIVTRTVGDKHEDTVRRDAEAWYDDSDAKESGMKGDSQPC